LQQHKKSTYHDVPFSRPQRLKRGCQDRGSDVPITERLDDVRRRHDKVSRQEARRVVRFSAFVHIGLVEAEIVHGAAEFNFA
jgi:hypothetical protein